MIIRSELGKRVDYRDFPQIDSDQIKYLWHSDFWDGALSGLLLLDGEKYWFEAFAEADEDETFFRRFFVIELTPEQLREEEQWHQQFQEKVGTHTDYDVDKGQAPRLQAQWREFYDAYQQREPLDLSQNTTMGWFER